MPTNFVLGLSLTMVFDDLALHDDVVVVNFLEVLLVVEEQFDFAES